MTEYETTQDLYDALSAPFSASDIEWRVGPTNEKYIKEGDPIKGQPLCYIDARTVMDRLDTVCGLDGWQCNYTAGVGGSIVCNVGINVAGSWVWKADGAGATDMEGEKGALSDAFKRAAVRFGIARYLYDIKADKVTLEKRGKSTFIPDAELKKLDLLHESYARKVPWGQRAGIQAYRLLSKVAKEFVTDPSAAQAFKDKNAPEIALLPVGMRQHLMDQLDRVGAATSEAA